ncbi:MAG: glycosyltransferase family 2 protein [Faecalibacillus intestinalis]
MKYRISILVPAYNVESKIEKCVNSLIKQTNDNFEIIIIDDGSSDNTRRILETLKYKFHDLKIYYQENVGVSQTRQRLIELASGDYIMFCDADDYLEKEAIETMYHIIEQKDIDLVIFGYKLVRKTGIKHIARRKMSQGYYNKKHWELEHIKNIDDLYWSALWNKCYKKEKILQEKTIIFSELMEDVIFNIEFLGKSSLIYVCDSELYNYVQIGESLTRSKCVETETAIRKAFNTYEILYKKIVDSYPKRKVEIGYQILSYLNKLLDRTEKIALSTLNSEIRNSELYIQCKTQKINFNVMMMHLHKQSIIIVKNIFAGVGRNYGK